MKGLMLKDLSLLKTQMNSVAIMLVIAVFMLLTGEMVSFVVTYAVMVFSMFGVSTMSYDKFDNGYAFLFTLPISRKLYVLEKYVFSVLSILTGAVIASGLMCGIELVKSGSLANAEDLGFVLGYVCGATIFLSLILPIQFQFGPEKSRIAMIVIFMVIMAGVFGLKDMVDNEKATELLLKISQITPIALIGGLVVLAIMLLMTSYLISWKIMEKKEF